MGFLFPLPFAVVCFVFAQVLGMWRGLNSRARAGQSGHPGRRGSDETSSCRFDKTAWFAFSRRAHGGRFHSSKFLEAKSEICFLGILLELESNSGQLLRMVFALAVRGPTRTECVFRLLELKSKQPSWKLSRLQKQCPAGAKLSLPDRHATRCWLKIFLIISVHLPF